MMKQTKSKFLPLGLVFTFLLMPSFLLASPAGGPQLDLLGYFAKEGVWETKADRFVIENGAYGFRFLDADRTTATSTNPKNLLFLGVPVYEARVFWGDAGIRRAELSLYNKGDAVFPLDKEGFDKLVNQAGGALNKKFGRSIGATTERPAANMVVRRTRWPRQSPMVQMEWAYVEPHGRGLRRTEFRPEYVRVVLVPKTGMAAKDNAALTGKSMLVRAKTTRQLRENILKNSKGDVMLENMPMVDQGDKGYCAAASAERILRYYGLEVDQHQVAQLAETSARGGTSLQGISEAVSTIGKSFKLDEKSLLKVDDGRSFKGSQAYDDLREYNRIAKKRSARMIDWEDFAVPISPRVRSIDIQAIWDAMDPEMLMEARLNHRQPFERFKKDVKTYVDQGIPLLWSCLVGIYPEVPDLSVRGAFGHMRLIIGYNDKKDELIYSDSWGAAHAVKRMSYEQAWAMTKGLLVLKPRM